MRNNRFFSVIAMLSLVAFVTIFAGCQQATGSSNSTTTAATSPAGNWINTSAGTIALASDGTFTWTLQGTVYYSGTYTYTSSAVELTVTQMNLTGSLEAVTAFTMSTTISGYSSGSTMSLVSDDNSTLTFTKE